MDVKTHSGEIKPTRCGLYVHVPFCETKCGYCDFFSVPLKQRPTAPLVQRLRVELTTRLTHHSCRVETVFCGGGTPTLLPEDDFNDLLAHIAKFAQPAGFEEFTVEANPATVDEAKARIMLRHGVTRVSLGAQSFLPAELATLERLHTPDDIAPSVRILRQNGIQEINLDLIFGIPGQSMSSWLESIQRAIDLQPDHLACYGLTYEPATRLTAQRDAGSVRPCPNNIEADMYELTLETLVGAGFAQYEISNYAQPGRECRHNLMYWRNEPYLGIGPSAAGCLGARRYKNVSDIAAYIRRMDESGHAEAETETITTKMLITEMLMMQLRLVEGLSIARFQDRTGIDPRALMRSELARLVAQGYVIVDDQFIALTRAGRLVADTVIAQLAYSCEVGTEAPEQDAPASNVGSMVRASNST